MIYLDNAATTLVKPASVGREMLRAMQGCASPGRGGHRAAMRASELVYRCREKAAELFHVPDPANVVFTMNATHGLNIAVRSLAGPGTKVLISGYEHNAVTRPLRALGAELSIASSPLFDRNACLRAFEEKVGKAELAVCTMVSNVFGCILPIEEIAKLCRERRVPLIVDASQAAGCLSIDFEALGAAFIAMPGHKGLFGPQGTGMLLCAEPGTPLLSGGSGSDSILQEMPDYLPDRLEAGTHNVPGIAGLLAGLEYVSDVGTEEILRREHGLLRMAVESLSSSNAIQLFIGDADAQSGVLSLRIQGVDCDEAAWRLSERGICLRSGLHCAPLAHSTAGTMDTGTLRMSFSPFVCPEEVESCCAALREIAERKH
jgi:Selenocysteine lyase